MDRERAQRSVGRAGEQPRVILYHWTNVRWLESILADGQINVTASDLSGPTRAQVGKVAREYASRWTHETEPQVVWLADNPEVDPTYLGMIDVRGDVPRTVPAHMLPPEFRKTRVRITVDVPNADVHWWPRWARTKGIRELWYQQLAEGHRNPHEWYVVTRPIPVSEFVEVMIDGQQAWPRPPGQFGLTDLGTKIAMAWDKWGLKL